VSTTRTTNRGSANDIDIHHECRNALNVPRSEFHSLHSRAITNAACEFNGSVMHFDADRIGTKVAFAVKLIDHIVLKLNVVFHGYLPSRQDH